VHRIIQPSEGPPTLLQGECLGRADLEEMIRLISGSSKRREILPERILCQDGGLMAWWTASERRPIFFQTTDKEFNARMRGKSVVHPSLLFVARPGKLSVFALADSARPAGDTPLYRAPYFNLYDVGTMCPGNARLPTALLAGDLPVWERAFFETQFTHTNIHWGQLTKHPGGHAGLWPTMAEVERTDFPAEWLVPLKLDVNSAVNE
jgi:PRTRC genetic system protein B